MLQTNARWLHPPQSRPGLLVRLTRTSTTSNPRPRPPPQPRAKARQRAGGRLTFGLLHAAGGGGRRRHGDLFVRFRAGGRGKRVRTRCCGPRGAGTRHRLPRPLLGPPSGARASPSSRWSGRRGRPAGGAGRTACSPAELTLHPAGTGGRARQDPAPSAVCVCHGLASAPGAEGGVPRPCDHRHQAGWPGSPLTWARWRGRGPWPGWHAGGWDGSPACGEKPASLAGLPPHKLRCLLSGQNGLTTRKMEGPDQSFTGTIPFPPKMATTSHKRLCSAKDGRASPPLQETQASRLSFDRPAAHAVPRPGIRSELRLPPKPQPRQGQILKPLCRARA